MAVADPVSVEDAGSKSRVGKMICVKFKFEFEVTE